MATFKTILLATYQLEVVGEADSAVDARTEAVLLSSEILESLPEGMQVRVDHLHSEFRSCVPVAKLDRKKHKKKRK